MLKLDTELGEIRFSPNVIKKIVVDAVHMTDKKAYIYHFKGKYQSSKTKSPRLVLPNGDKGDLGSITVEEKDTGLNITVYLVVRFGNSIKKLCVDIIEYIFENVESVMGEKPEIVRVIVTGVESNEIAKRKLEYSMEARLPGVINEPS